MVTGADKVNILFGQNVEVEIAFGSRTVVETVAFDAIAGIDEKEVYAFSIGLCTEVVSKGMIITPISGEGWSEEVRIGLAYVDV